MDSWQEHRSDPELDAAIMRARMRRPARLVINADPAIREYLAQQATAGLPDPQPVLIAAARRRIVAEMRAELRRDQLRQLVASVNGPGTRGPRRREGAARLRMLQEMVSRGVVASRDLTRPVRRDTAGRRALAAWALQIRHRP
jgi:hypothetical protein